MIRPDAHPHLTCLLGANASTATIAGGRQKAAKNDDAEIPTGLWDRRLWLSFDLGVWERAVDFICMRGTNPLDILRYNFLFPLWRRSVWRNWNRYYREHLATDEYADRDADCEAARDCLSYVMNSTWWDWKAGSRLLFWRWPKDIRLFMRDGMPIQMTGPPPAYKVPQRYEPDEEIRIKVTAKLQLVLDRGYIISGLVLSLTSYFCVPKGEGDIRMVYDGTKSGLNEVLWVPSFSLPDIGTLLSKVEENTWMCDIDIGDMFLNFCLDKNLHKYCGVDLSPYFDFTSWKHWGRCAMGLKPSPYVCVRSLLYGEEIIRGDKSDPTNPFRYDYVRLNLPGMMNYDPRIPWTSKVRRQSERIATDFVTYVDDIRPTGESKAECILGAKKISGTLTYLGIQDAYRKTQDATKDAGAWCGCVVIAGEDGVAVTVTQEKWDKTKRLLETLDAELTASEKLNYKALESARGFLLHVTSTYPAMVPFIKGFHLTLDSWRPNRDTDGWRLTQAEIRMKFGLEEYVTSRSAPEFVNPAPRLRDDLNTLMSMVESPLPPKRFIRSKRIAVVHYGFGDASGSGFGSVMEGPNGVVF